jgi:hypothetical protein
MQMTAAYRQVRPDVVTRLLPQDTVIQLTCGGLPCLFPPPAEFERSGLEGLLFRLAAGALSSAMATFWPVFQTSRDTYASRGPRRRSPYQITLTLALSHAT